MGRYPAEIAEVYWEGEKGLTLEPYSTTALVYGIGIPENNPQKAGCRAWNLPTPIGWSKTSPRPLREAFRVRMGRSG
jgi:hypothetical protein